MKKVKRSEIRRREIISSYLERVAEQGEISEEDLTTEEKADYGVLKEIEWFEDSSLSDYLSELKTNIAPLNLVKNHLKKRVEDYMELGSSKRAQKWYKTFKEIIEYNEGERS